MIELSSNIIEYLTSLYGKETAEKYSLFIKEDHSTYLRINRQFIEEGELIQRLASYGIKLQKIEALPNAYKIVEGQEAAGKTLEYNLGRYYIQSLSSMIPPLILNPDENDVVMDLCSAPGSKATQISEMMNNRGTLVANEQSTDRIKMLVHNLDKLNIVNMGVIQYKGEWLSRAYNNYFDKILVDAPCSALGVIQKKEEVSNWWSVERMEKIAAMQLMLISAAIKMVKVGGEIVYSTCTLTPEENELVINHVLNKYPLEVLDIELPIASQKAFTTYRDIKLNSQLSKARRILPWEVDSEGFFIIKLRKTGDVEPAKPLEDQPRRIKFFSFRDKEINKYLLQISDEFGIDPEILKNYSYLLKGNDIFFTDKEWHNSRPELFQRIGTHFGLIDKRNNAHLHSFAAQHLSASITRNIVEIKEAQQLKDYLNGSIVKTGDTTEGQKIIKFNGLILGTAASVQNGLKSQYPKSKRIHEISFY